MGSSVAAAIVASAPVFASELGGSVTLTSDYVYEGLSRTCGGPAAQGDVHGNLPSSTGTAETFGGVWGSVGIGSSYCRSAREINVYVGQRWALGATNNVTLTYVHYAYPGGIYLYDRLEGHRFDYDELGGAWAFEDRLYLTLGWTPNAIEYRYDRVLRDRKALRFGAELHQPVGQWLTLSAGAGYDEVSDVTGAGYAFWSAGIGRAIGAVELDLSYFRTSPRAERLFGSEIAGGRVAATAVWHF